MRALVLAAIFAAATAPMIRAGTGCAAPNAAASTQLSSKELGFSYRLPSDWTVEDTRPSVAQAQQQAAKNAQSDSEIRAVGCMEAPFKARHGNGASSVVIVAPALRLLRTALHRRRSSRVCRDHGRGPEEGLEDQRSCFWHLLARRAQPCGLSGHRAACWSGQSREEAGTCVLHAEERRRMLDGFCGERGGPENV